MILLRTWQCCMAETVKRKSRKSSSASSTDDNLSTDGKKLRHNASLSDSELCESDKVLSILNMAGEVIPKFEVLEKLKNLERYVKAVNEKLVICRQRWIVSRLSKTKQKLEDALDFANTERESFKEKFDKLKCEINQLRDKKLYMEVYQPRENLRFLGIKEADMEEDVREVWLDSSKQSLVWKMQTKSNSKGSMLESVFLPMVDLDKLSHVFCNILNMKKLCPI